MKRNALVPLAAAALLLAGCVVTSVCPFYTEKDLVDEPALAGDWEKHVKDGPGELWKFVKDDKGYALILAEEGKPTASVMEAHPFKLQGQLFLDIASIERDYHVIPPHYLLKVTQLTPALRMSGLNHKWVDEFLSENPGTIRHHYVKTGEKADDRRVVLTANTAELQEFVLDHLNDKEAWNDNLELTRRSAQSELMTK